MPMGRIRLLGRGAAAPIGWHLLHTLPWVLLMDKM